MKATGAILINGATFTKFSNDSLGGNFMRDYSDLHPLTKTFLEKKKKNLDKNGFNSEHCTSSMKIFTMALRASA